MFKRLIGRNFVTSSLCSLPGLTIGISLACFHLFGKTPFRKQPLYVAVMYFGKVLCVCMYVCMWGVCLYVCVCVCVCVCGWCVCVCVVCMCVCGVYVCVCGWCVCVYVFSMYIHIYTVSYSVSNLVDWLVS